MRTFQQGIYESEVETRGHDPEGEAGCVNGRRLCGIETHGEPPIGHVGFKRCKLNRMQWTGSSHDQFKMQTHHAKHGPICTATPTYMVICSTNSRP